jgi:hypothetical protein
MCYPQSTTCLIKAYCADLSYDMLHNFAGWASHVHESRRSVACQWATCRSRAYCADLSYNMLHNM